MMVRATTVIENVIGPLIIRVGEVALLIRLNGSRRQNVWLFSSDRQESNQAFLLSAVVTAVHCNGSGFFFPERRCRHIGTAVSVCRIGNYTNRRIDFSVEGRLEDDYNGYKKKSPS